MEHEAAAHAEHSPLAQFEIDRWIPIHLFGIDASFTNAAFFMVVSVLLVTWFMMAATRGQNLVPGRLQALAEASYGLIAGALRDNVGPEGKKYFPFVFSLFMFVLFANFIGLIPFTFTVTSHIIVTFALAFFIFLGVTLIGLWRHKLHFFSLFLPHGVPIFLAPLLVPIEIIGYLTRPVSLSVRLAANMLAGHTMLEVFAGFMVEIGRAHV